MIGMNGDRDRDREGHAQPLRGTAWRFAGHALLLAIIGAGAGSCAPSQLYDWKCVPICKGDNVKTYQGMGELDTKVDSIEDAEIECTDPTTFTSDPCVLGGTLAFCSCECTDQSCP